MATVLQSAKSHFPAETENRAVHSGDARWTAILLAGQRPGRDPLADHCGEKYKALVRVAGKSMLARVADALLGSSLIGRVVILAQEPDALLVGDTVSLANNLLVTLATSNDGIATSIAKVAGTDIAPWPILVTTADHALLTTDMVNAFLAETGHSDIAIGVGDREIIEARYPMTQRTWLKFRDGHYSGANLFALRGENTLAALDLWATIEQDRKKSWKIISSFGPRLLFRAITRSIRFEDAVHRAGKRLGVNARPIVLTQPEAAIDVDKPTDLELAEHILSNVFRSRPTLPDTRLRNSP
ncbi:NTP transferase domain-containing protein [Parasphingopyxis algicola]|uniref:nucleotidyltransferase family protein n=1 Tax=Parasphingopyxis algicola TaxID=2026624 RepID=UPI0015A1FDF0|nr:nucleotidyltransferase family protein [Parasphingopyxis algicola]QLC24404.1 NTP transferase domain-containing protein [Parasphingopyxis algicola]